MTTYTHHISGRLRVRYPELKNNPAQAKAVAAALRRVDGILSVAASTVTGSLLIHYNAQRPGKDGLLQALYKVRQQIGLDRAPHYMPLAARSTAPAETLANMALGMIVEKCIERFTIALVAALL